MIEDTAMSDTHAKFRGLWLSSLRELRSPEKGINNTSNLGIRLPFQKLEGLYYPTAKK